MKSILSLIISATLVASGYSQTRNVLVGTNNTVVQPTNFWSADASNARTGLGLGTAATSSATSFQPSSAILSNLSVGNGVNLTNLTATIVGTNIAITNVSGLQSSLDSKLETNGSAANLTNFPTLNQSTTGTASNVTGVVGLANGGTGGTNAASARSSLGATTIGASVFTLANPSSIRFIRLNADNSVSALPDSDFRTAIGLGTAATNSATAFQPSSLALTNLSSNNGSGLTNLAISNVVGLQTSLNQKLSTNGNASGVTNITAANIVGSVALASNVTGTIAISNGGTGATNAATARTNLGLGWSALTNTNSSTSLLGFTTNGQVVANTGTNVLTFIGSVAVDVGSGDKVVIDHSGLSGWGGTLVSLEEKLISAGASGNWAFDAPISFIGTNSASTTRTNLGLGWAGTNAVTTRTNLGLGATWLTNTNSPIFPDSNGRLVAPVTIYDSVNDRALLTLPIDASSTGDPVVISDAWNTSNNRTALGLGRTNIPLFTALQLSTTNYPSTIFKVSFFPEIGGPATTDAYINKGYDYLILAGTETTNRKITALSPIQFGITSSSIEAATTRTNLGLGATWLTNTNVTNFRTAINLAWSALTNSNAGTGLVSVDTNGTVVSPTNFWQVAPIQTLVQDLTVVVTTQTNNATNARNLYIYSLATNVTGISNTILLPTNAATFVGDEVTVIHQGTTNTTTVIRQDGSTNNLITLNRFDEAVKFIRESGQWDFYHNISYVEPIQFSGTNASNNIAATRTNLGLPLTALTNSNTTNFQAAVFQTNTAPVSGGTFGAHAAWMEVNVITNGSNVSFRIPLYK